MSVELDQQDNLMQILEAESLDFSDFVPPLSGSASTPKAGGSSDDLGSPDLDPNLTTTEGQRDTSGLASDEVSLNDLPWAEYLQMVKERFIRAKPLDVVEEYAANMGFRDWMDYVIKLLPKDIKIESNINFRAMIDSLGPIDKEQYRLPEPVVEAEFCEIVDAGSVG